MWQWALADAEEKGMRAAGDAPAYVPLKGGKSRHGLLAGYAHAIDITHWVQ